MKEIMDKKLLVDISHLDEFAEDGVFCVPLKEPLDFDLRKVCEYAKVTNNGVISEEIIKMYRKK